jgi:hypothetical protein
MVNKTFLPPRRAPRKIPKQLNTIDFPNWHGFRLEVGERPGLGEPRRFISGIGAAAWESGDADRTQGEI